MKNKRFIQSVNRIRPSEESRERIRSGLRDQIRAWEEAPRRRVSRIPKRMERHVIAASLAMLLGGVALLLAFTLRPETQVVPREQTLSAVKSGRSLHPAESSSDPDIRVWSEPGLFDNIPYPEDWILLPSDYPFVQAEKNMYGAAATAHSAILFLGGGEFSQEDLAEMLETGPEGTSAYRLTKVLNDNQKRWNYQFYGLADLEVWQSYVAETLRKGVPVFLGASFRQFDGWLYDSERARYLTIIGIREDFKQVAVADPWANQEGASSVYLIDCESLFNAYKNALTGLIY